MPQLMPLNWIFSMFMLIVLGICSSMIYSSSEYNFDLSFNKTDAVKKMNMWYW